MNGALAGRMRPLYNKNGTLYASRGLTLYTSVDDGAHFRVEGRYSGHFTSV